MGIYQLVKEGTERAAREAGKKKEEERLRKQREQELRRDASKAAGALAARGVVRTAGRIDGWLIHEKAIQLPSLALEKGQTREIPGSTRRMEDRWHLGADGGIYRGNEPLGKKQMPRNPYGARHPWTNAEMELAERYLAEFVVKNHLDPELFKDDNA